MDIFSLFDPTKCLAIGRLQGIDPSKVVGGQPLGPCWCEILVQIVMERNEQLIRPYGLLQTIEDALGAPIAWPLKSVYFDTRLFKFFSLQIFVSWMDNEVVFLLNLLIL